MGPLLRSPSIESVRRSRAQQPHPFLPLPACAAATFIPWAAPSDGMTRPAVATADAALPPPRRPHHPVSGSTAAFAAPFSPPMAPAAAAAAAATRMVARWGAAAVVPRGDVLSRRAASGLGGARPALPLAPLVGGRLPRRPPPRGPRRGLAAAAPPTASLVGGRAETPDAAARNADPDAVAVIVGASRGVGLAMTQALSGRFKGASSVAAGGIRGGVGGWGGDVLTHQQAGCARTLLPPRRWVGQRGRGSLWRLRSSV